MDATGDIAMLRAEDLSLDDDQTDSSDSCGRNKKKLQREPPMT